MRSAVNAAVSAMTLGRQVRLERFHHLADRLSHVGRSRALVHRLTILG